MLPVRALALSIFLVSSCAGSHDRGGDDGGRSDAGPDECGSPPFIICVSDCSVDAGVGPVCTDGAWACPRGTRDLARCPPTDLRCPEGIDPWNPDHPGNACTSEGARCTSGGPDACGAAMFCDCTGGRWSCAVAEPDPVCWCGREPALGDRCSEEGASCGECCPTPGGTGWPAMQCVDGHWAPGDCPDLVCPPLGVICPADAPRAEGTPCSASPGALCGDACCGTAITCVDGIWQHGPDAACACGDGFRCGDGTCRVDQLCHRGCGPDDGIDHTCRSLPADCRDCSCIPLWGTEACEMIDGHPHVRDLTPCG
jgi:hypothetical protein